MGVGYKGLIFGRNNGWILKNMDKELPVPQMPPKISAEAEKVEIFEKTLSACP